MVTNNSTNNESITGDSGGGSAQGYPITFRANLNCGSTVKFTGSGSTISLTVSDTTQTSTCIGFSAGNSSASSGKNVMIGYQSGQALTNGNQNTAVGSGASNFLTSGVTNCTVGYIAGYHTTTGSNNTAIGAQALQNLITGNNNTCIGYGAGYNYTGAESYMIAIGHLGVSGEASCIRIGVQGTISATSREFTTRQLQEG
jgi:hypothetical protein